MTPTRRIGLNFGGGYVPGLNAVITGAVLAASRLGWEVVGIRDGFDGLLWPERYPEGGLVRITPAAMEHLSGTAGCFLGAAARIDPFHVRGVNADNAVEEVDRCDDLLARLAREAIHAVISVVDAPSLGILLKLSRRGLRTIAVPKAAENQIAATALSFGFNSTLSFTAELLEHARQAAQSARKIGVIEVPGEHAGWLALQSGVAVCADAVLIPEIPFDLSRVAAALRVTLGAGRAYGLVVVAEGATPVAGSPSAEAAPAAYPLKASLSPGATGPHEEHVINRSGHAARTVALELQRLTNHETYPLVLGPLARGGPPTAVDRQLGLSYGAAAVRALDEDRSGVMVAFQPPDLAFVPLAEAINRVRTVPAASPFMQTARSLGIALGD